MFQTNQILFLNGFNKFKTAIKYANQFSLISKHNFIYFIESSDYHFEFTYLAKQLDINITDNNNDNQQQQILNIDKIIKKIYNEITNRCLNNNNKRTKILFIFNELEDQLLDLIQLAPKTVYFLIISNLINKRFNSFELNKEENAFNEQKGTEIIKNDWNLLKYYSIFYSSFIPIELIEYLQIKLVNDQVIESVLINENIGFSIKQSIQTQIKDYLKDNDIQEIIDKLNSSITYLFSFVGEINNNKFYYYNLKEIVNFVLSCNKADNQMKSKYALEMADYCLKWHYTNKSIEYYEISFQYLPNLTALNNICKCGRSDKAILNYFKLDLNDENVLFHIGLAYFNLRNYLESLNYLFRKCLMCAQTLNLIGQCYQKQENLKKALEFYEKSINQSNNKEENKVKVLNNIGLCYIQMKLYLKSIDYLNESLNIRKTINCLKYLGLCYFKLEKYKQSLNYYEDAFKMNLNNELNKAECFYFIGKCYKSMGKFKKSIDFYKESIKINRLLFFDENIDIVTFLNAGNVYENLGKCTKAIEYYEKSLSFIYKY